MTTTAAAAAAAEDLHIKIYTSDAVEFDISSRLLHACKTLKHLIEDCGDCGGNAATEMPPLVTSHHVGVLQRLVDSATTPLERELVIASSLQSFQDLLAFANTCNFLDLARDPYFNEILGEIRARMQRKTVEQLRNLFCIEPGEDGNFGFSARDLEQIAIERKWFHL